MLCTEHGMNNNVQEYLHRNAAKCSCQGNPKSLTTPTNTIVYEKPQDKFYISLQIGLISTYALSGCC